MTLMMKEQLEGIDALSNISINKNKINTISLFCKLNYIKNIVLVARGSSNNAGLYFKYLIESTTDMHLCKFYHSTNTILHNEQNMTKTLCIVISQSGTSPDTFEVLKMAKAKGALTVAITNNENSPISNLANHSIYLNCGEEQCVAATKTFTAEIAVLTMLANSLAQKDDIDFASIIKQLKHFKDEFYSKIENLAKANLNIDNLVVLSRGTTQFLGEELCLKLAETSYKLAKAFSVAEFIHGPIALMDNTRCAILLAPDSEFTDDYIAIATKLHSLGVNIIAFSDINKVLELATTSIKMPNCTLSTPFFYTLALQSFSNYLAVNLGINPDTPRGLNKVTKTI
ncbi:MAG: SIS domain-containing protein [Clostridia bacterium]